MSDDRHMTLTDVVRIIGTSTATCQQPYLEIGGFVSSQEPKIKIADLVVPTTTHLPMNIFKQVGGQGETEDESCSNKTETPCGDVEESLQYSPPPIGEADFYMRGQPAPLITSMTPYYSRGSSLNPVDEQLADRMDQLIIPDEKLMSYMVRESTAQKDYDRKLNMKAVSVAMDRRTAWERELIKVGRENYKYDIFVDDLGRICRICTLTDAATFECKDISNARNMKAIVYRPIDMESESCIYLITAMVGQETCNIALSGKDLTGKTFHKQLLKNGIRLKIRNEYIPQVEEQLLAYLIQHAEEQLLPYSSGWHFYNGLWQWVPFHEKTFKEVRKCLLTKLF